MRTLLSVIALVLAGVAVLWAATDGFQAFTAETARRVEVRQSPRPAPELPLQLQSGRKTRLSELEGQLVLATFIYTRCRTMCPMLGMRMKGIRDALAEGVVGRDVHFLAISFDPGRDHPAQLMDYAQRYEASIENWWVARPRSHLARILDAFGVVVLPQDNGDFVHNGAFYLLDRDTHLVRIIPGDASKQAVKALREHL